MQLTDGLFDDRTTLAKLATDYFLLARHCNLDHSPSSGRAWERTVSQFLWRPDFPRRQHAGVPGLFSQRSQSGTSHEIDGAGQGPECMVLIESKSRNTLDKSDIATFHLKCFDFYRAAACEEPKQTSKTRWWPLLVSSEPASETVRRLCCDLGVVLCDPECWPLPALLYAAAQPNSDDYLSETHLSEMVRLAEPTCVPMQQRWRLDRDSREVCLSLNNINASEISDLLFLQDELTKDLLNAFDHHKPGGLAQRARPLLERFEAARLAS